VYGVCHAPFVPEVGPSPFRGPRGGCLQPSPSRALPKRPRSVLEGSGGGQHRRPHVPLIPGALGRWLSAPAPPPPQPPTPPPRKRRPAGGGLQPPPLTPPGPRHPTPESGAGGVVRLGTAMRRFRKQPSSCCYYARVIKRRVLTAGAGQPAPAACEGEGIWVWGKGGGESTSLSPRESAGAGSAQRHAAGFVSVGEISEYDDGGHRG